MGNVAQSPENMAPDPWVTRFAPLVPAKGTVLDLASGGGRHARMFLGRGHSVVALDRDVARLSDLADHTGLEISAVDVEAESWPFEDRLFDGIVVVNYLHRPLLPVLARSLRPGGVLIYRTFALGNERYGKPSNPNFLLRPNELLDAFAATLEVVAYEAGEVDAPRAAVIQRICAVRRANDAPVRLPPA